MCGAILRSTLSGFRELQQTFAKTMTSQYVWLLLSICATVPFVTESRGVQNDAVVRDALALLQEPDYSEIVFVYYSGPNCTIQIFSISQLTDLRNSLDPSKPTAFYFHGFTESIASKSVKVVAQAFCERGSHNFVVGDWGKYAVCPYTSAYFNVKGAGRVFGQALNTLVGNGLPCETLWVIGHSLGAHLAGIIADTTTFTIPRITGLDPAGPGFIQSYLTAESAKVVDVIHTDALFLGYAFNDGTIDFWPNGGSRPQPGCDPLWDTTVEQALLMCSQGIVACSHAKSWAYLAASVLDEYLFPTVLCANRWDFETGACPPNSENVVYMGYLQPGANAKGSAYLRTRPDYPYGLGTAITQPAS